MRIEELLGNLFDDSLVPGFMANTWEKQHLHLPAVEGCTPAAMLSLSEVDDMLARSDLRTPTLRMMLNGGEVDPKTYTTTVRLGGQSFNDWIQPDKVLAYYRLGATLIFQLAHYSFPGLKSAAARMQRKLGFNVEMNAYLTPPGNQGFAAHYDTHSVVVVQLHGTKRWSLYSKTSQLPLLHEHFSLQRDKPGEKVKELILRPGDVLYVPRGLYHSAEAMDDVSLHVTIGLFPPKWIDLAKVRLGALERTDHGRASLHAMGEPPNFDLFERCSCKFENGSFGALVESTCRVKQFNGGIPDAGELIFGNACCKTVELFHEHQWQRYDGLAQGSSGRLLDLVGLESLPMSRLNQQFVRREDLEILIRVRDNTIDLRCYSVTVSMPKRIEAAVRFVVSGVCFRLADIPGVLDDSGRQLLVRRLLDEGVLCIAQNLAPTPATSL